MEDRLFKIFLSLSFGFVLLFLIFIAGSFAIFSYKSFNLAAIDTDELVFDVKSGSNIIRIANQLNQQDIYNFPRVFRVWGGLLGYSGQIKSGEYVIKPGMSAKDLLTNIAIGKVKNYKFTIKPGWQFNHVLRELDSHNKIVKTIVADNYEFTDDLHKAVLEKLKINAHFLKGNRLEGFFWPETYNYTASTRDIDILQSAHDLMHSKINKLWQTKQQGVAIKSPYDAIILGSIIEKESGFQDELRDISGVYHRRLFKNMRLQADPTVIYALDNFNGRLTYKHLKIDSPYNTYRYKGLPPTPIAIPSEAAIMAALMPRPGDYIFFVADGEGRHTFTSNLNEHNKAVKKFREYQKQQRRDSR